MNNLSSETSGSPNRALLTQASTAYLLGAIPHLLSPHAEVEPASETQEGNPEKERISAQQPSTNVVVLTASRELTEQVANMSNSLLLPDLGIHAAALPWTDPALGLGENTRIIATTLSGVRQYDLPQLLSGRISLIVVDEFDSLFDGKRHHEELWRVLETLGHQQGRHRSRDNLQLVPQIVFVGATLPDIGKKSKLQVLRRKCPGLVSVTSQG